jgi:ABC-type dipeptide/oligopeptide/nickel transport system permease component
VLPLLKFLFRRFVWMILTVWIVYTIAFFLSRAVEGDPFAGEKAMSAEVKRYKMERYGYDKPLVSQYARSLWLMTTQLDLHESRKLNEIPVTQLIAEGFPVSASLGIFALVFALLLGTVAGVISAVYRYSFLDFSFMTAATLGIAVPNFVLASIAIMLFVFVIPLAPAGGWGTLRQLVLPALCLGAPFAAYIARLTRTGMMEVLNQDYIRTAYAKGLSDRRVVLRHALRGAILPVVSYLGPATAGILTGSLVLERIFFIPGMGSHFIEAALQRDFPVALGMVLVYTCLLFIANAIVDLSYVVIDPRVKLE